MLFICQFTSNLGNLDTIHESIIFYKILLFEKSAKKLPTFIFHKLKRRFPDVKNLIPCKYRQ